MQLTVPELIATPLLITSCCKGKTDRLRKDKKYLNSLQRQLTQRTDINEDKVQKYSRLRYPLQKFSSFFKAEPLYEDWLKVYYCCKQVANNLNLPLLYFVWTEEYCQTRPTQMENKSQNLWHVTSILVCCIFDKVHEQVLMEAESVLMFLKQRDMFWDQLQHK